MTIIGIRRDPAFSLGSEAFDAAIFEKSARELELRGYLLDIYEESQFEDWGTRDAHVIHMARSQAAVAMLSEMESRASIIINSPSALRKCTRKAMVECLRTHAVASPASAVIESGAYAEATPPFAALWLKRADSYTLCEEDLVYADTLPVYRAALKRFCERGISELIASEHHEGNIVKFYGVGQAGFFYSCHSRPRKDPKLPYSFSGSLSPSSGYDELALRELAFKVAGTMKLLVWGGDAIVKRDGSILLLDMNDFPSFRPCMEAAAKAIAESVISCVNKRKLTEMRTP